MKKKSARLRSSRDIAVHSADVLRASQNQAIALSRGSVHGRYLVVGAGSVLDVAGSNLRTPELESLKDDAAKIKNDFYRIGNDMRDVLGRVHRLG